MIELGRVTGLTTRAAIAEDGYPVFIDRVDAPGMVRFHTPLGVRELPHTSAAGKAILAALPADLTERIAADTGLPHRTPNTIRTLDGARSPSWTSCATAGSRSTTRRTCSA